MNKNVILVLAVIRELKVKRFTFIQSMYEIMTHNAKQYNGREWERDKKGIKNHIIKMSIEYMQKSLMCHEQVVWKKRE